VSDAPRYAPEFRLVIDDEPVPAALRASVSSIRHTNALAGADRVEVTLINENLRWLDHRLLNTRNNLVLSVGYASGPLRQVFAGEIVAKSAAFPASGGPTLEVVAQDRRHKLQKGTHVRWFAIPIPMYGNMPLPDIASASLVALDNLLMPMFDVVGAAISILLGVADAVAVVADPDLAQKVIRKQANESDFDFLTRIAMENGWEMLIEHRGPLAGYVLKFMSPLDKLSSDVTLKYGQSLIDFTPRISEVGQIASVTAYVWISAIKTQLAITLGWDWDTMSLTIDIRPVVPGLGMVGGGGEGTHLIEEPLSPTAAPRRMLSELIPKLNKRLTATGSTVGDPRIVAGGVGRFEGLGEQFGGLYRFTSVTNTIDGSGYRTGFEARKEIWFGSIPAPQQGAFPVRPTGSFLG
jgi:hypothetical protein